MQFARFTTSVFRSKPLVSALWVCLCLIGIFGIHPASVSLSVSAASPSAAESQAFDPLRVNPMQTITNRQYLIQIARAQGKVRVIVGIDPRAAQVPLRQTVANALTSDTGEPLPMSDMQRMEIVAAAQNHVLAGLRGAHYTLHHQYRYIPYLALTVNAAGLERLQADPSVTYLASDALEVGALDQTPAITGFRGPGGVWEMGYQGEGQVVAIIDTGVDNDHPAFEGQIVAEACFGSYDSTPTYEASPWCEDGETSSTDEDSGDNCDMTYANCGHGTYVAGVMMSLDPVHRGAIPNAKLIAVQVFSRHEGTVCQESYGAGVTRCAMSFISDQVAGFNHIYELRHEYNIAAVNISMGGFRYYSQATCDQEQAVRKAAIDLLRSVNIPTVGTAGNKAWSDSTTAPGCISSVILVGASNDKDQVASFANTAPWVDLLAPGASVWTPLANGGWGNNNGSSLAAPLVTSMIAVMRQAVPGVSIAAMEQSMKLTGKPITDLRNALTFPRLQANAALQHLLSSQATATPTPSITPTLTETPTETPTATPTETPTVTPTETPTETPTVTPTETLSATLTQTPTPAPTQTLTPSAAPIMDFELLTNGSFELDSDGDRQPDGWTGANLTRDRLKCTPAQPPAQPVRTVDACVWRFRGGGDGINAENARLSQRVMLTALPITTTAGDTFQFSAVTQGTTPANGVTIRIVVRYLDPNLPRERVMLSIQPTDTYTPITASIPLNGAVRWVSVRLMNTSATGKLLVSEVSLRWQPGANDRSEVGIPAANSDGTIPIPLPLP